LTTYLSCCIYYSFDYLCFLLYFLMDQFDITRFSKLRDKELSDETKVTND
jgi:hypothetical protein